MAIWTTRRIRQATALVLMALFAGGTCEPAWAAGAQDAKAARRTLPRADYRFKSTGTPDIGTVRRVVTLLGVGQKVDVRTTRPSKLRARILSIGEAGFVVALGRSKNAVPIAYGDVTEIKPAGLHVAYKAAIGVAAGYGAAVVIFFIAYSQCQCG